MAEVAYLHTSARLLAEAGWSPLLDRLLARFCHDLSGRTMALDAAVRFLDSGRPTPPTFPEDVGRVWELSELLALVPADLDAAPAAVIFREALAPAVRLYRQLVDPGEGPISIEVPADLPPLLVTEGRFRRAMLLYLDLVGSPRRREPLAQVTGDSEVVKIQAPITPERAETVSLQALAALFSLDAGDLSVIDGRCIVRFRSLAAARAHSANRERA